MCSYEFMGFADPGQHIHPQAPDLAGQIATAGSPIHCMSLAAGFYLNYIFMSPQLLYKVFISTARYGQNSSLGNLRGASQSQECTQTHQTLHHKATVCFLRAITSHIYLEEHIWRYQSAQPYGEREKNLDLRNQEEHQICKTVHITGLTLFSLAPVSGSSTHASSEISPGSRERASLAAVGEKEVPLICSFIYACALLTNADGAATRGRQ